MSALNDPALVDASGAGVTFGELDRLSACFAAVLRLRGVTRGDRVVVQVEKTIAAVALYLACLRTGAIFVPLNTAYTRAEVDYFVADAEPQLFVSVPDLSDPTSSVWAEALRSDPDLEIVDRD